MSLNNSTTRIVYQTPSVNYMLIVGVVIFLIIITFAILHYTDIYKLPFLKTKTQTSIGSPQPSLEQQTGSPQPSLSPQTSTGSPQTGTPVPYEKIETINPLDEIQIKLTEDTTKCLKCNSSDDLVIDTCSSDTKFIVEKDSSGWKYKNKSNNKYLDSSGKCLLNSLSRFKQENYYVSDSDKDKYKTNLFDIIYDNYKGGCMIYNKETYKSFSMNGVGDENKCKENYLYILSK